MQTFSNTRIPALQLILPDWIAFNLFFPPSKHIVDHCRPTANASLYANNPISVAGDWLKRLAHSEGWEWSAILPIRCQRSLAARSPITYFQSSLRKVYLVPDALKVISSSSSEISKFPSAKNFTAISLLVGIFWPVAMSSKSQFSPVLASG